MQVLRTGAPHPKASADNSHNHNRQLDHAPQRLNQYPETRSLDPQRQANPQGAHRWVEASTAGSTKRRRDPTVPQSPLTWYAKALTADLVPLLLNWLR